MVMVTISLHIYSVSAQPSRGLLLAVYRFLTQNLKSLRKHTI
jgi:hypothetical protein